MAIQPTLRQQIYDDLLRMILDGELAAGSELDERMLTDRMQVSRTPFREAVGILSSQGLIEIEPYRGFRVRSFTPKQVNDLYILRRVLERCAAELAVQNISNAHIEDLEMILNNAIGALSDGDMVEYGRHDRDFHTLIARLSGNDALISALSTLSLQVQMCRLIANRDVDFVSRAVSERDQILDAFRARDASRAGSLMDAHIADVQQAVMEQLNKSDSPVARNLRRMSKR